MRIITLIVLLVLLSACDLGGGATPTPTPGPGGTPVGQPTQTGGLPITGTPPPSVRPCQADDFDAVAGYQGATGSMAGAVRLTNRSGTPCAVSGRPGIHLVDAGGSLMPVANLEFNRGELTPTPESEHGTLVVKPGQTVYVFFVWSNWCGQAHGPYRLAVALPGEGGQLNVPALDPEGTPLALTPRCDQPDATSTISIGVFERR